jgi:pyrimidine operon attenuation protein/uracil phosphoribosyltransferase
MRQPKYISVDDEIQLLHRLSNQLLARGLHAGNTIIVTVSTDYSSFAGQYLRHSLSYEKDICDGFGIDVPYPDEVWENGYAKELEEVISHYSKTFTNKNLLLVEAAVIRGGNYKFVIDFLKKSCNNKLITLALYENTHSEFKSDFVGEYYDNNSDDITFWWERENKHWP